MNLLNAVAARLNHGLDDQDPAAIACRSAAILENFHRLLVVPSVENSFKEVDITLGNR